MVSFPSPRQAAWKDTGLFEVTVFSLRLTGLWQGWLPERSKLAGERACSPHSDSPEAYGHTYNALTPFPIPLSEKSHSLVTKGLVGWHSRSNYNNKDTSVKLHFFLPKAILENRLFVSHMNSPAQGLVVSETQLPQWFTSSVAQTE